MEHTIASLHLQHTTVFLDYGQEGEKFWVAYKDKKGCTAARTFDTAAKAIEVYLKLAGWILLGSYSDSDRRNFLMTGTMK